MVSPVVLSIVLLLASAAVIYGACEFFVNGVEWVGRRMDVGATATGTVLAAFGTALPESVVTFVAVAFGVGKAQKDIGVGAALGGPLVLATVAYAVVGLTLIATGRRLSATGEVRSQFQRLSRDQGWFLTIFAFKIGLGLIAFAYKPWLGLLFLAAYGVYFWREMRPGAGADDDEDALEPLKIAPRTVRAPARRWPGCKPASPRWSSSPPRGCSWAS